ncbi:Stress response protein nst1 [Metarhizium acridum]|nr:Stress response protein nst1 [Metarhizium acridum]
MMEQLAERRMAREEDAREHFSRGYGHPNGSYSAPHNHPPDDDDYEDEEDEEEDYEDSQDEEYEDEEVYSNPSIMPSRFHTECCCQDQMTEEQRMEEGRRMFQIFAARMFEQRVLSAYKEKVAKERQDKLLEELEEESRQVDQQKAKKAKNAQKKKDKAAQKKQALAEEKARKEAEKAAEEAARLEAEQQRIAEQRHKAEEKRKQKESQKKAEEEARLKKEADRQRRIHEQRERQAEQERKAREAKEREKKLKEEQRQRDQEARDQREREAQERKEKQERDKREKEARAAKAHKRYMKLLNEQKKTKQTTSPPSKLLRHNPFKSQSADRGILLPPSRLFYRNIRLTRQATLRQNSSSHASDPESAHTYSISCVVSAARLWSRELSGFPNPHQDLARIRLLIPELLFRPAPDPLGKKEKPAQAARYSRLSSINPCHLTVCKPDYRATRRLSKCRRQWVCNRPQD